MRHLFGILAVICALIGVAPIASAQQDDICNVNEDLQALAARSQFYNYLKTPDDLVLFQSDPNVQEILQRGNIPSWSFDQGIDSVFTRDLLGGYANLVPIHCTDHRNLDGVGIFKTRISPPNKMPCSFGYLGDEWFVTAAHCLISRTYDNFAIVDEIVLSHGTLVEGRKPIEGCKVDQTCVPDEWALVAPKPLHRDIGFVRMKECNFDQTQEPDAFSLAAFPIEDWSIGTSIRIIGYLQDEDAPVSHPNQFFSPDSLIWTGFHKTSGVTIKDEGGLLCHGNSTLPGTSGSPMSHQAGTPSEISCVHSYGSNPSTGCPTNNACTLVTTGDVVAFEDLRHNRAPAGYTCR